MLDRKLPGHPTPQSDESDGMPDTGAEAVAEQALADTERAGLVITLSVRTVLVALLMLFIGSTQGLAIGWFGMAVTSTFLITGLIYLWLVRRRLDRDWMRFAFVTLDLAMLAVVATQVPLSIHGDVPQIFVFRVYGVEIFFFVLATSALSLSPRLVLWTGVASVAAIWAAWGWIVSGMDRWVRWSAIDTERTAEKYVEIVLDPDHIQVADRVIESGIIICTAAVTAAAVQRARRMLRQQLAAEGARSRVAEVFGRFVPSEVAAKISQAGGILPPDNRQATVLFVDIEGFTSIAERVEPGELVEILDAYFDTVSEVVQANDGVVISFIGDAALASFNAPLELPDHAASARRAGDALLHQVAQSTFGGYRLAIRVGIATGPVAAATVGGRGRRAYTLYSDTVNLAQRLEQMNKSTGTRCLLSADTWSAAGRPADVSEIGEVSVKGREQPVAVYTPVSLATSQT